MRTSWIAGLLLVLLLIAFRAITAAGYLPNFSPLPAMVLCSLIFLRGHRAWMIPLAAWAITDPLVSTIQGFPVVGLHHLGILLGLSASVAIAFSLRSNPSTGRVLGGSLLAAVAFYFLTNTVSFFSLPIYPKSFAGFIQAQWTGPANLGPTWLFLRNAAAANLIFASLFLAARPAFFQTREKQALATAETR